MGRQQGAPPAEAISGIIGSFPPGRLPHGQTLHVAPGRGRTFTVRASRPVDVARTYQDLSVEMIRQTRRIGPVDCERRPSLVGLTCPRFLYQKLEFPWVRSEEH